jgi:hypothetical protein
MSDVVNLPISLDSDLGRKLVSDLARFSEGVLTEAQVKKKHHFDDSTWEALGDNEALLAEVDADCAELGMVAAKTEKARHLVIKAPDVVSGIMLDPTQNARHRIDAAKVLDAFADSGPKDGPAAAETLFLIKIDLSGGSDDPADVYERTINLTKPTGEPPQKIEAIPTKEGEDDNGGIV